MNPITIRRQIIEIQLISLEARKKMSDNFELNVQMSIESCLLEGQIKALHKELELIFNAEKTAKVV